MPICTSAASIQSVEIYVAPMPRLKSFLDLLRLQIVIAPSALVGHACLVLILNF